MRQNWGFMSAFERFLHIVRIILSVSIVLLSLLQLLAVLDNALNVVVPLMGVLMIIQAVQEWKHHRISALISLFAAAFVFTTSIAVALL